MIPEAYVLIGIVILVGFFRALSIHRAHKPDYSEPWQDRTGKLKITWEDDSVSYHSGNRASINLQQVREVREL
jgi:hypothetical protein